MLEVDIDKILPLTEARDNFNKIIDEVEGTDHMYVLTKNGKPSAVVVGVNHLEKLTGKSADELTSMVEKKADSTPVVEEVNPSVPTDSVGTTEPAATGQSIQPGPTPSLSPPLEVPPETSASIPTSSPTNVGTPASGELPPPAPDGGQAAPTSSAQRAPSDSGPGSVPAPSSVEGAEPGVASNQAPAPPNQSANGGAAASDSDLFV